MLSVVLNVIQSDEVACWRIIINICMHYEYNVPRECKNPRPLAKRPRTSR